jgi:hypothetical protein
LGWTPRVSLRAGIARTVAAQRRSLSTRRKAMMHDITTPNEGAASELEAAA